MSIGRRSRGDWRTHHVCPQACRDLWSAMLVHNIDLAFERVPSQFTSAREITEARRWIGSRRFRLICALAGIDDEYVLRGLSPRLARLEPV